MNRRDLYLVLGLLKLAAWLMISPFVLAYWAYRTAQKLRGAWLLIRFDEFWCSGCGEAVSLVGRWECGACGFVFDGFYFSPCVVCGAVPPYIQCRRCRVGIKNPTLRD